VSLFPTAKSDPELAPFRPGLTFAFFNALAWQIGIGTPMVLFAEQLGATPLQVGLAYSFVFTLAPIQIVATVLLPRFGFKAVMLGGWRTRSIFLAVPAVIAVWVLLAGEAAWMVWALVLSVFFFCLFRSIGAASGVSWFYAILPEGARGRYFASDQFLTAVACAGTLLASAASFALLPVYPALLLQYGIALAGSTISYYALKRLPDAERPRATRLREVLGDTPQHLFAPSAFRRYAWLAAGYAVISTAIPPFAAYFLKAVPQLPAGQIMLFEVVRYAGVMAAAWLIRSQIDLRGAKPFFRLGLAAHAFVGVSWWVYLHTGFGGTLGMGISYFVLGAGGAAWTVANLNYLPRILQPAERTLAVAIHGALTSLVGGLSPILWGIFLRGSGPGRTFNVGVFEWFFVTVVAGAVVLAAALRNLPESKGGAVEPLFFGDVMLRPFRALTGLLAGRDKPGSR
jgi:hypothetical protein